MSNQKDDNDIPNFTWGGVFALIVLTILLFLLFRYGSDNQEPVALIEFFRELS